MYTPAERNFEKLVLQLFKKYQKSLVITVNNKSDSCMDLEIRIPELGDVGFRAVVTSTSTRRSEADPDPRCFGDTEEVTRAAMQNWYPGKTNTWTENRRSFMLQAWNLPSPEMKEFTANYEYDPGNATRDWSSEYEIEQIFNLLIEVQKVQAKILKESKEKEYSDKLTNAFEKMLK